MNTRPEEPSKLKAGISLAELEMLVGELNILRRVQLAAYEATKVLKNGQELRQTKEN
jgi:hypothetical protein